MRVRVLRSFVTQCHAWQLGDETDLPDETAVAFMRDGVVERIGTVVETAALNRGEKAVRMVRPVK